MEHEVGNVGLLSLVHHVVMLVNMENIRWRDAVCLPFLPSPRKCVIVTLHNHRHWTGCPVEQLLYTVSGVWPQVEVIEVDIKDRTHRSPNVFAKKQDMSRCRCIETIPIIKAIGIITDTLWLSPAYHVNGQFCKIWRLVIIFEHRNIFRP